jgi:hypothetical protein
MMRGALAAESGPLDDSRSHSHSHNHSHSLGQEKSYCLIIVLSHYRIIVLSYHRIIVLSYHRIIVYRVFACAVAVALRVAGEDLHH